MADKPEDAAAAPAAAPPKEPPKKKKTKRSASTRKEAMSASARSTGSRRGDTDGEGKRRRSRSTDKIKARRDSGSRRLGEKERSSNGEALASAPVTEGWERKGRTSTKDGAMRGSGRQHHASSPQRPRRVKSDGAALKGEKAATADRSRSRSPSRASPPAAGHAPRLPQRTSSSSSSLSDALEANKNKHKQTITKKDSFEEASLGDYQLYAQQQQQKRGGVSLNKIRSNTAKMGEIPEESLGSFTTFVKKYDQEKLLGLHDADEAPDVYGQNSTRPAPPSQPSPPQQQQQDQQNDVSMSLGNIMSPMNQQHGGGNKTRNQQNDVSMSLGNIMSPMNQYGGGSKVQTNNKPPVEESLGDFTAFHQKYEQDQLLGLNESTVSALQSTGTPPAAKERKPSIPEESMGDFVQLVAKEEKEKPDDNSKLKQSNSEEKERESHEIFLPKNRIEKLGKRGGVGYRIMVDTPGGHSQKPMKIVVAIEFEEETDSDESEDEEEEDPLDNIPIPPNANGEPTTPQERDDQAEEIVESGHWHLPVSAVEDDHIKEKPQQHRKRKQGRKSNEAPGKPQKQQQADDDEEDDSEEDDDEIGPLAANMNRWNDAATSAARAESPKQPEQLDQANSVDSDSNSTSTHSTVSSVTLESALGGNIQIHTDRSPSNQNTIQRKPGGIHRGKGALSNAALRRPSGMVQAGGTAALLKRPSVAPHNLGTRRGLMLRQQSEASMMSTGTSKSNDSSWVNPSDTPDDYEASFMQLNFLNLEKPEMQTNEEVEQAELPDAQFESGVEGIAKPDPTKAKEDEKPQQGDVLEPIAEGKDPTVAASELLGMKTMLKHIKRVAPKRSKSFEFDRDMPKQMWNKMFAKSQKGELPGSQYVDNDDSTGHEEDDKIQSTRTTADTFRSSTRSAADEAGEQVPVDEKTKSRGLFSTIKKVTGTGLKSVMPGMSSTKKSTPDEAAVPEQTEAANYEASEGSIEMDGILQDLDKSLALNFDASTYGDDDPITGSRRESNEGSGRAARSSRVDGSRRGGTARNRAARAQHAHNRSLRDTVDYYTAEQEDDDLPQLDAVNEEEAKRKPRVRARRKVPNRTKSDEGIGKIGRTKPSDGARGAVHRTRSQEGSPARPPRDVTKKMHQSFSGMDPSDAPPIRRQAKSRESVPGTSGDAPPTRRQGSKSREASSGQQDAGDAPTQRRPGTKSREGGQGKDNMPHRTRSHDKGMRSSAGRKQRPQRKKSNVGIDDAEAVAKAAAAAKAAKQRGADIEGATEEQLRELLDYG